MIIVIFLLSADMAELVDAHVSDICDNMSWEFKSPYPHFNFLVMTKCKIDLK